jgi:HK97 family phage prohead protease
MSNQEKRYIIAAELRTRSAGDDALIVEARIAKYGALSQPNVPALGARERFLAGAFRSSLQAGDDVVALFNHDMNSPLARISNGKLQLHDSPEALTATIRLNPAVQAHRDIYEHCKDGLVNACSFAFSPNDGGETWTQETDEDGRSYALRSVSSAKLFDVSLLSATPAYGNGATSVQARNLAYRYSVEPVRKLNVKSFETLIFERSAVDGLSNRSRAKMLAVRIKIDARLEEQRRLLTDFSAVGCDNFRHYVEERLDGAQAAVPAGDTSNTLRQCEAGSLTSSREDHLAAAASHTQLAMRGNPDPDEGYKIRSSPYQAPYDYRCAHYRAADLHRRCAEGFDKDGHADRANAALLACRDAQQPRCAPAGAGKKP